MGSEGGLRTGIEGRSTHLVEDGLLTMHVGGGGVLSTPAMIGLMEWTAQDSVAPHLPQGATTVGFEVCVRHLAAAPPGSEVELRSVLKDVVDGRKLHFDVECRMGETLIGTGTHRRTVVPLR